MAKKKEKTIYIYICEYGKEKNLFRPKGGIYPYS